MKIYAIRFVSKAEKALLKINQSLPAIGSKIRQQIEELKTNPHLGMKLKGTRAETRRIRVGDYRMIYEVYDDHLVIVIVYIGPRGGAY